LKPDVCNSAEINATYAETLEQINPSINNDNGNGESNLMDVSPTVPLPKTSVSNVIN